MYYNNFPSVRTERRLTEDPEKLKLVARLQEQGGITLLEAYNLLTETVTIYTYHNQSYPWVYPSDPIVFTTTDAPASAGYVWTMTDATTGAGEWKIPATAGN